MKKEIKYEILFPNETEMGLLEQASLLTSFYEEQGLMLGKSVEELQQLAKDQKLGVALANSGEVLGCAALTFEFPQDYTEFGAWAVVDRLRKHHIGIDLFLAVASIKPTTKRLIALANDNSSPIFKKLGGEVLLQTGLPDEMFEPCLSCKCQGKQLLARSQKCVDTVYNLEPIIGRMKNESTK